MLFFFHSFSAETKEKTKGIYNNTYAVYLKEQCFFSIAGIIMRYRNVRLKYMVKTKTLS